jgi:hypothetical protein
LLAGYQGALTGGTNLVLDLRAPCRVHGALFDGFVAHDENHSDKTDDGYGGSNQLEHLGRLWAIGARRVCA